MILVTGGAGFIGSRLCAALAAAGAEVVSLDDYSTGSSDNHVPGVEYRRGHTTDIARLVPETPQLIFHLGEYARVEASFADVDQVARSNGAGTAAVIEFWHRTKCKLVYAGSSTRFGDAPSPYSEAKAWNADKVLMYGDVDRLPHAVTYFYNVYGPGERAGATGTLIETFRQQHARGEPLTVVAPGTQRRNFTHIDDIVNGLLLVAREGAGAYQIGAAESYSVLDVAAMFGGAVEMLPARPGNRSDAPLDTGPVRALGWAQRHWLADYIAAVTQASAA